jgi:hypothetical protein
MGIASFLILVLRGGLYSKKCQDSDPLSGGGLYARGAYSEGGAYMPDYTVRAAAKTEANHGPRIPEPSLA